MMSNSDSIVDLYTRIPDYSEVKHLGNSDFINTVERLKEEFRKCRAILNDDSDVEYISSQTSKVLNISQNQSQIHQGQNSYGVDNGGGHHHHQHFGGGKKSALKPVSHGNSGGGVGGGRNVNIVSPKGSCSNLYYLPATNNIIHSSTLNKPTTTTTTTSSSSYLSISSCALHKNPNDINLLTMLGSGGLGSNYNLNKSDRIGSGCSTTSCGVGGTFRDDQLPQRDRNESGSRANNYDESAYAEDFELCSSEASTPESGLSRWSSSPEIYSTMMMGTASGGIRGDKEYCPPTNIEKRLLFRRSQNNSAPSIPDNIEQHPKSPRFKAHPVPAHVHKPLFDYIMLKNKKRSDRVREQSKQKLLAQVKPFSFSNDPKTPKCSGHHHGHHGHGTGHNVQSYERGEDFLLNNSRPVKSRRNHSNHSGIIKTNNNKFSSSHHQFKANPAPPRTKALLAAIKLREQQEYRELKKRLRAEAMMKTASLPPSMAARDRRTKANLIRLDNLLSRFHAADHAKDSSSSKSKRHWRESSTDTFTDDDRLTEGDDFYTERSATARHHVRSRGSGAPLTSSSTRPTTSRFGGDRSAGGGGRSRSQKSGNFTPYNEPLAKITGAGGLFEATSNDNHASKLRIQVAKAKELSSIQKEEQELLFAMKMDRKRQKLRDAHYQAWRRAGSYSSAQDIAMRRQLRMAAAILDRESYRKEMSSMLNRVRSAPLLLEGLRERKYEPCKKHREGFNNNNNNNNNKRLNKLSSPRYMGQQYFNSKTNWSLSREPPEPEKSETAAMAEGSLTNSDNESVKNPELEFDQFDDDDDDEDDDQEDEEENDDDQFEEEEKKQEQEKNDNNHTNHLLHHHNNKSSNGHFNSKAAQKDTKGPEFSKQNGIMNGHHNAHSNLLKINGQNGKSPPLTIAAAEEEEEEENLPSIIIHDPEVDAAEEEDDDDERRVEEVNVVNEQYQDEADGFEDDVENEEELPNYDREEAEEDIFANF